MRTWVRAGCARARGAPPRIDSIRCVRCARTRFRSCPVPRCCSEVAPAGHACANGRGGAEGSLVRDWDESAPGAVFGAVVSTRRYRNQVMASRATGRSALGRPYAGLERKAAKCNSSECTSSSRERSALRRFLAPGALGDGRHRGGTLCSETSGPPVSVAQNTSGRHPERAPGQAPGKPPRRSTGAAIVVCQTRPKRAKVGDGLPSRPGRLAVTATVGNRSPLNEQGVQ